MIHRSHAALLYLQLMIIKNWCRRAARSVFTWIIVAAGVLWIIVLLNGGGDGSDDAGSRIPVDVGASAAVLLMVGSVILGFWRVAGAPPFLVTLADTIFILTGPLPERVQYAFLLLREISRFLMGTIFGAIGPVAALSLVGGSTTRLAELLSLTLGTVLLLLLGQLVRHTAWITTERVAAAAPERGERPRRALSLAAKVASAALVAWLLLPLVTTEVSGGQDALRTVGDRLVSMSAVPPLSWAAAVFTAGQVGNVSAVTGALALGGLIALLLAVSIAAAHDFAQPLAITAERQTDARGQFSQSGADVQWATLSALGSTASTRLVVPPFGRGPWAILWASLVRWLRYNVSTIWLTLVVYGVVGLIFAVAMRLGWLPPPAGWGTVLIIPFLGTYTGLLDELRKPFIYLTPGPAWIRLTAGALTSVLDMLLASVVMVVLFVPVGGRPISEGVALVIAATGSAFLAQGAACLVQVFLPHWIQYKVRVTLTVTQSIVAAIPAGIGLVAVYLRAGAVPAFLTAGVAVATGALLLAIAARRFSRLEMPG